jgi:HlyD family secretion protein
MPATVTVETHKGEVFHGKVTEIATVATSQSWTDESNKTFKVEITMDKSDVELRAGVTSKVEIQVEEIDDVLQVPIHAVFPEEGQHFCFVFADGGVERRVVEVGKNNAHHVEVTSGLEEGERVLLYDPRLDGDVETKESGEGDGGLGLSSDLAGMGGDA